MARVLTCPACRSGVLARRGDPLCADCGKASRELPSRPVWVFDSPLLRQALAAVNLPAVPAIVRAACGLSQRDLAAIVGWSPATLSYYEHGQRDGMFDIRTVLHFADAVGMPRRVLLPLVLADANDGDDTGAEPGWRGFGGTKTVASAAVNVPQAVGGSHARYWRACADVLHGRDRAVGGVVLLSSALRQWQHVASAVQGIDGGEQGQQLRAAAGELALCTGLIALDAGHPVLARTLCEQARELAAAAEDVTLAVHALAGQSMLHAEEARTGSGREAAQRALRLAYAAADEGRYIPVPQLHALVALCHAGAASLLGDGASFTVAIGRARRELARGGDPPQRLRHVSEVEVTGAEARGYLNLGQHARGATLYRRALASELSPRDRACYGAGLAEALLKQGEREEAVAAAMDVLSAFEGGVTSIRCLSRLRLIRQAVEDTIRGREFRGRLDAAEKALTAEYPLLRQRDGGSGFILV